MNGLRTGSRVTVAGIALIPIERVRISSEKQPCGYWFSVTKEAFAVVICDQQGPRAVCIDGHERPIDELTAAIPELETVLTEFLAS